MSIGILLKSGGGGTGSDEVTATRGSILTGYSSLTVDSNDEVVGGTMPTRGGATITPTTSAQTLNCSGHYMTGNVVVNPISPTRGGATITPTTSQQIVDCSGKYMTGNVVVNPISPTMGGQTVTPTDSDQVISCANHYMTGNISVPAVSGLSGKGEVVLWWSWGDAGQGYAAGCNGKYLNLVPDTDKRFPFEGRVSCNWSDGVKLPLYIQSSSTNYYDDYFGLNRTINLTNVDYISFRLKCTSSGGSSSSYQLECSSTQWPKNNGSGGVRGSIYYGGGKWEDDFVFSVTPGTKGTFVVGINCENLSLYCKEVKVGRRS